MNPGPELRVAVVVSRYNATITDRLLQGARDAYGRAGLPPDGLEVFHAPGAFEVPAIASAAECSGAFDGIVALGCIIKGETSHDRVLADAVTGALADLSLKIPVGLGILTVDSPEQALARAGAAGGANKGDEAMSAVLQTIVECQRAFTCSDDDPHGIDPEQAAQMLEDHTGQMRGRITPRPDKLADAGRPGAAGLRAPAQSRTGEPSLRNSKGPSRGGSNR